MWEVFSFVMHFTINTINRLVLVLLAGALAAACSTDPEKEKVEYLESGQEYFQKGKYAEAGIQFRNAIQADQNYAEAHYQLARTFVRLGEWRGAYQELQITVELEPDHFDAQLELATLLLATGEYDQAQEKACGMPGTLVFDLVLGCDVQAQPSLSHHHSGHDELWSVFPVSPEREAVPGVPRRPAAVKICDLHGPFWNRN